MRRRVTGSPRGPPGRSSCAIPSPPTAQPYPDTSGARRRLPSGYAPAGRPACHRDAHFARPSPRVGLGFAQPWPPSPILDTDASRRLDRERARSGCRQKKPRNPAGSKMRALLHGRRAPAAAPSALPHGSVAAASFTRRTIRQRPILHQTWGSRAARSRTRRRSSSRSSLKKARSLPDGSGRGQCSLRAPGTTGQTSS